MEININEKISELILAFFLLILPGLIIALGLIVKIENIVGPGWSAWYFILAITWFGSGIIFFGALKQ